MGENIGKPRSYELQTDERVTSIMVYTQSMLIWGEIVTKEAIRVSTYLRSSAAPQYIKIHDAQVITFSGGASKPYSYRVILLPTPLVIAFHIKPPAHDPLDYDPTEANRKMEPTTALVGTFRMDGKIRMSVQTSLDRYLDVVKELYTSMYEVEITNPSTPGIGVIKVPFILLNNNLVLYSPR